MILFLLILLLVCGICGISFAITGALFKILLWLCVMVPIGIVLCSIGLALCCTIILIPVGLVLLKTGARVILPAF